MWYSTLESTHTVSFPFFCLEITHHHRLTDYVEDIESEKKYNLGFDDKDHTQIFTKWRKRESFHSFTTHMDILDTSRLRLLDYVVDVPNRMEIYSGEFDKVLKAEVKLTPATLSIPTKMETGRPVDLQSRILYKVIGEKERGDLFLVRSTKDSKSALVFSSLTMKPICKHEMEITKFVNWFSFERTRIKDLCPTCVREEKYPGSLLLPK